MGSQGDYRRSVFRTPAVMARSVDKHAEIAPRHVPHRDVIEDAFLIRRFQLGEASAFDELFLRYRRFVFKIVFRIVDDTMLSEDLTQTVFFKLWKAPLSFRDGSLPAWITRVSRNCALDELRRRRPSVKFSDIAADQLTPFERVAADLDARRLRGAVLGLTAAQRLVIELNFFAGLTHGQIADLTSIPLGTVKTRIRAGLQSLRSALDENNTAQATVIPISRPPAQKRLEQSDSLRQFDLHRPERAYLSVTNAVATSSLQLSNYTAS